MKIGSTYSGSATSFISNGLIVEGNVGIGTTGPSFTLDVLGGAGNNAMRINAGAAGSTTLRLDTFNDVGQETNNRNWAFRNRYTSYGTLELMRSTNSTTDPLTTVMAWDKAGNVGIGTTGPTYQLQLSTDSAAKPSTNTWTIASDIRVKKEIRPYINGLKIVKSINPVWFKYNGKAGFPEDNQDHIGVIGQEVVKAAPYTVNTFWAKLNPEDKESTQLLNFNSHALTFDLINSVKELDSNITKLSQENQGLKEANKELKSEMENLKTRLSRLEAKVK